jgi:hypothetical protein
LTIGGLFSEQPPSFVALSEPMVVCPLVTQLATDMFLWVQPRLRAATMTLALTMGSLLLFHPRSPMPASPINKHMPDFSWPPPSEQREETISPESRRNARWRVPS